MVRILWLLTAVLSFLSGGALPKTGQTTIYHPGDDGFHQAGVERNISRDHENNVVTDHLTGLMWQDDGNAAIDENIWSEAVNTCEIMTLGGYGDWRLPSIKELKSIVPYEDQLPPILFHGFENAATSGAYWSATEQVYNPLNAWILDIAYGYDHWYDKGYKKHIRCVRGSELVYPVLMRNNANDTVYDAEHNLTWQDEPYTLEESTAYDLQNEHDKVANWSHAVQYCNDLIYAGVEDWRLPNIIELYSIADQRRFDPAIYRDVDDNNTNNANGFKNVAKDDYWSSTTYALETQTHYAWNVAFDNGNDDTDFITDKKYVRCVRSGSIGNPAGGRAMSPALIMYLLH